MITVFDVLSKTMHQVLNVLNIAEETEILLQYLAKISPYYCTRFYCLSTAAQYFAQILF